MLLSAFHSPTAWTLMTSPVGLQLFAIDWLRASWQTRAAWITEEASFFHSLLDAVGLGPARFDPVSAVLAEVMDGHADLSELDDAIALFTKDCQQDIAALEDPQRMATFDGVKFRIAALRDYVIAITDLRGALLRLE